MRIDRKFLENMNRGNIAINAGLCLGSIAVFGFNPIALCACFIGSDVILSLANEAVTRIIAKKAAQSDDYSDTNNAIRNYSYHDDSKEYERSLKLFEEARKVFLKEKEELEKKRIAEEMEREKAEKQLLYSKVRGLDAIMESIDNFQSMWQEHKDEWSGSGNKLKKVAHEFDRLKANLEKKPESSFIVGGMFTIYTAELMKYTTSFDSIPDTQKREFNEKYSVVLKEFLKYIGDINERIEAFTVSDASIGLDTLLSELKEVNNTRTPSEQNKENL